MSDSYLWNKSGPKDPFIEALVSTLAVKRPGRRIRSPLTWLAPLVAAAAAVLAIVTIGGPGESDPTAESRPIADEIRFPVEEKVTVGSFRADVPAAKMMDAPASSDADDGHDETLSAGFAVHAAETP